MNNLLRCDEKTLTKYEETPKYIIFENKQTGGFYTGKIGSTYSKGEVVHWPNLHHRNIAPLVKIININNDFNIYLSTYMKQTLRELIHHYEFIYCSDCFNWKKIYIEDILWGIDYLHRKSLCHLNINDENIFICPRENKAVIADLSNLSFIKKGAMYNFQIPNLNKAPELTDEQTSENPIPAEIWSIGVMIMNVFLSHSIFWALRDLKSNSALDFLLKVSNSTLKSANYGSKLNDDDIDEFKEFVSGFLRKRPQDRVSCKSAAASNFIQSARKFMCTHNGNEFFKQRLRFINTPPRKCNNIDKKNLHSKSKASEVSLNENELLKHIKLTDSGGSKILRECIADSPMRKKDIVPIESEGQNLRNFEKCKDSLKLPDLSYDTYSRKEHFESAHTIKTWTKSKHFNVLTSHTTKLHTISPQDYKVVGSAVENSNCECFFYSSSGQSSFSIDTKEVSFSENKCRSDWCLNASPDLKQKLADYRCNEDHLSNPYFSKNDDMVKVKSSKSNQNTNCQKKDYLLKNQTKKCSDDSYVMLPIERSAKHNESRINNKTTTCSRERILGNHSQTELKNMKVQSFNKQKFQCESSSISEESTSSSESKQIEPSGHKFKNHSRSGTKNMRFKSLKEQKFNRESFISEVSESSSFRRKQIESCRQILENINSSGMENSEVFSKQKLSCKHSNNGPSVRKLTNSCERILKNHSQSGMENMDIEVFSKQKYPCNSQSISADNNGSSKIKFKSDFIDDTNHPVINKIINNSDIIDDIRNGVIKENTNNEVINKENYGGNCQEIINLHGAGTNYCHKKYSYEKAIARNRESSKGISPDAHWVTENDQLIQNTNALTCNKCSTISRDKCACLECQWHRIKKERRSALEETDFKRCCRLTNKQKCQVAKFLLKAENENRTDSDPESPIPNSRTSRIDKVCSSIRANTPREVTEHCEKVAEKAKKFTTPCFRFFKYEHD